jgi:hypothetical protein
MMSGVDRSINVWPKVKKKFRAWDWSSGLFKLGEREDEISLSGTENGASTSRDHPKKDKLPELDLGYLTEVLTFPPLYKILGNKDRLVRTESTTERAFRDNDLLSPKKKENTRHPSNEKTASPIWGRGGNARGGGVDPGTSPTKPAACGGVAAGGGGVTLLRGGEGHTRQAEEWGGGGGGGLRGTRGAGDGCLGGAGSRD